RADDDSPVCDGLADSSRSVQSHRRSRRHPDHRAVRLLGSRDRQGDLRQAAAAQDVSALQMDRAHCGRVLPVGGRRRRSGHRGARNGGAADQRAAVPVLHSLDDGCSEQTHRAGGRKSMRTRFMHERSVYVRTAVAVALLAAGIGCAAAAEEEAKPFVPPGLPAGLDWEFNLNAGVGVFGFANSLYTNPKPDQPSGDLSDNWWEGSIKPALGATLTMENSSQLYGKASVVGERTYRTPPPLVGEEAASFDVEDLYIGW